jgi:purine-nucleoside phosphorylase
MSECLPVALTSSGARTAIVLGSGLGGFVDSLDHRAVVDYSAVPGLPVSGVPGHAGRYVVAEVAGVPLLIAQGRVHLYEGWSAAEVVRGIEMMHSLGVRTLILTNAAGVVNPAFSPGTWMMLSDHINMTGHSPLRGGAHFVDLSEVYSLRLREKFRAASVGRGMRLFEGVYAAMPGPQYETPAEIRMLRTLGADAVGMSTVPEAVRAKALGMEVAAFSCLTNWGAGMSGGQLDHAEVSAAGRLAAGQFAALLNDVLPGL